MVILTYSMKKNYTIENGFTVVETLLVILILAVIGFGGYYVWHNQHKSITSTTVTSTALKSHISTKTATATTQTPNPYAGWKSYTLTDEKLSFQYPSTWHLTDYTNTGAGNQDYHADWVELTSSSGFDFTINDGLNGGDPLSLASSDPISVTYNGQSAYMVFSHPGNPGAPGSVNNNAVGGFILLTNPNDQTSLPQNKNVTVHMASYYSSSTYSSSSSAPGQMSIIGNYTSKNFSSVKQAMQDKEYQNAKLVIESMHY